MRSCYLDVEDDRGKGHGDDWVRNSGMQWCDFRLLVGGSAELSASEMLVVARVKAL